MENLFNTEMKAQQEWSWLLALDLFLGGLGGGLFLLYGGLELPPDFALVAVGLVAAGAVVLLAELGHPLRAWRAVCRPCTSWISRGVLLATVFMVSACIHAAPSFTDSSWRLWGGDEMGAKIISLIAVLSALGITLYPGFVLSASRSIPFWNTPMLAVMFSAQSLMGACAIVLLVPGVKAIVSGDAIHDFTAGVIILNLVLIAGYLLAAHGKDVSARESVRLLVQTRLRWTFWIGVVGSGLLVPLIIIVLRLPSAAAAGAGALMLAGGLLFRYAILKAGVYLPLPLAGVDLSRLNRTTDTLAREYAIETVSGQPSAVSRQQSAVSSKNR